MARKQIDRYLETMSQRRGFMECKGTRNHLSGIKKAVVIMVGARG